MHSQTNSSVGVESDLELTLRFSNPKNGFKAVYQRNNKKGGHKNLRCFPDCNGGVHVEGAFCGGTVDVEVDVKEDSEVELIAFAMFRPVDEAVKLAKGSEISLKEALANTGSRGDQIKPWFLGVEKPKWGGGVNMREYLSLNSNQVEPNPNTVQYNLPKRERNLTTPTVLSQSVRGSRAHRPSSCSRAMGSKVTKTFQFNLDRKGWHYGWSSSRHTSGTQHCFTIFMFSRKVTSSKSMSIKKPPSTSTPLSGESGDKSIHTSSGRRPDQKLKCVGILQSTPFRIYCRRRASTSKLGSELGDREQSSSFSDSLVRRQSDPGPSELPHKRPFSEGLQLARKRRCESLPPTGPSAAWLWGTDLGSRAIAGKPDFSGDFAASLGAGLLYPSVVAPPSSRTKYHTLSCVDEIVKPPQNDFIIDPAHAHLEDIAVSVKTTTYGQQGLDLGLGGDSTAPVWNASSGTTVPVLADSNSMRIDLLLRGRQMSPMIPAGSAPLPLTLSEREVFEQMALWQSLQIPLVQSPHHGLFSGISTLPVSSCSLPLFTPSIYTSVALTPTTSGNSADSIMQSSAEGIPAGKDVQSQTLSVPSVMTAAHKLHETVYTANGVLDTHLRVTSSPEMETDGVEPDDDMCLYPIQPISNPRSMWPLVDAISSATSPSSGLQYFS